MSDIDRVNTNGDARSNMAEKIRDLILQEGDPARVLELHYWCQEPGLLDCIRAIIAMPDEARSALQAFLSDAAAGEAVTASRDPSGTLNLRSIETEEMSIAGSGHPSRLQS